MNSFCVVIAKARQHLRRGLLPPGRPLGSDKGVFSFGGDFLFAALRFFGVACFLSAVFLFSMSHAQPVDTAIHSYLKTALPNDSTNVEHGYAWGIGLEAYELGKQQSARYIKHLEKQIDVLVRWIHFTNARRCVMVTTGKITFSMDEIVCLRMAVVTFAERENLSVDEVKFYLDMSKRMSPLFRDVGEHRIKCIDLEFTKTYW